MFFSQVRPFERLKIFVHTHFLNIFDLNKPSNKQTILFVLNYFEKQNSSMPYTLLVFYVSFIFWNNSNNFAEGMWNWNCW